MRMLNWLGCGAGTELLCGEKLNPSQVIQRLEAVIGSHQDVVCDPNRKLGGKCVRVRYLPINAQFGGMDGPFTCGGNDFLRTFPAISPHCTADMRA